LNAIQAIEQNGEIKITVEKKDNVITISFENSGPMIPEKNLLRIFEPLFTTKFEGTGLGLSSCKSIVINHGGMILASNYPTTFKVVLPQIN